MGTREVASPHQPGPWGARCPSPQPAPCELGAASHLTLFIFLAAFYFSKSPDTVLGSCYSRSFLNSSGTGAMQAVGMSGGVTGVPGRGCLSPMGDVAPWCLPAIAMWKFEPSAASSVLFQVRLEIQTSFHRSPFLTMDTSSFFSKPWPFCVNIHSSCPWFRPFLDLC